MTPTDDTRWIPRTRTLWSLALIFLLSYALSFPPFGLWWMIFVSPVFFAVLVLAPRRTRTMVLPVFISSCLLWGWFHWWVSGITSAGYVPMVLYLAGVTTLSAFLLRVMSGGRLALPIWLALPLTLTGVDYLRGLIIFDGYSWFLYAQPLIDFSPIAGLARIGGVWLPGLIALALSGCLASGLFSFLRWQPASSWRVGGLVALALSQVVLWHWVLDDRAEFRLASKRPVARLLLVQTDLDSDNKIGWTYERQLEDVPGFMRLTVDGVEAVRASGGQLDLIAWPETMLPSVGFERGDQFSMAIENLVGRLDVPMLVGSPSYLGISQGDDGTWGWDAHYNSAYLIGPDGPPYARVDKVFLTPFGETMPYISNWEWLEQKMLAFGANGMRFELDAGDEIERVVFPLRSNPEVLVRAAVPICFEDTVAPVVREMVWQDGRRVADLLINLSNDGWFGTDDSIRAMHELCARWRAVENETWMVRAVNTGRSAAISPDGRVDRSIGVGARADGTLLVGVEIPGDAWATGRPPYAVIGERFGSGSWWLLVVLCLGNWLYTSLRTKPENDLS